MIRLSNHMKSLKRRYEATPRNDIIFLILRPLLAEFFTMFIHTFWGSMVTLSNKSIYYPGVNRTIHPEEMATDYVVSTLMPAFQAGLASWMFIVLYWKICNIHFNPAISVAFVICGVLSPWLFVPYVIMQCSGSILGAAVAQAIKGDAPSPFLIADNADITAILFCEVMMTGIMVFFANAMVVDKTYDQATGPLAIGFTIFQGIIAGKWVGAGGLNPARAFGPAVVTGGNAWNYHWVWWVGAFVGSIIYSIIYMAIFAPPDKVWLVKLSNKLCGNDVDEKTSEVNQTENKNNKNEQGEGCVNHAMTSI